jgi:hypothetical protein
MEMAAQENEKRKKKKNEKISSFLIILNNFYAKTCKLVIASVFKASKNNHFL